MDDAVDGGIVRHRTACAVARDRAHDEPRVLLAAVVDAPFGRLTIATTHLSFVPGWNVWQLRIALAFLLITGTLVQARVIPSGSMESTLLVGDHLLMSRMGYDASVPFTQ